MRKNFTKLLTTSLLASAVIFAGCDGTQTVDGASAKQLHQVSIKKPRVGENLPDVDIWHNYVDISSTYNANNQKMKINVHCNRGISPDVYTYQVYIDSDQNGQTGFSAGESSWEISGADYLIEDNALFESSSHTKWKWVKVSDISVSKSGSKTKDYKIEYTLDPVAVKAIFGDSTPSNINISIEPVDKKWKDTNNYVSIQNVNVLEDEINPDKVTKDQLIQMIQNGEDVTQVDVSGITDMSNLFYAADNFNQDISGWDVSNVTDMNYMFGDAENFNQDISSWDVSNVTNMMLMFWNAYAFNQDISGWDVSSVTKMDGMFNRAFAFNQPIGSWDVSSVTDMNSMFWDAEAFNQPLGNWDVSSVTDMEGMFWKAYAFNQPLGSWDVSKVTNMGEMFLHTQTFNQDISSWDVSKITTYSDFSNDSSLQNSYRPHFNTDNNFDDADEVTADGKYALFVKRGRYPSIEVVDIDMNVIKHISIGKYGTIEKAKFRGNDKLVYRANEEKKDIIVSFLED